jgi:hypothetical protein
MSVRHQGSPRVTGPPHKENIKTRPLRTPGGALCRSAFLIENQAWTPPVGNVWKIIASTIAATLTLVAAHAASANSSDSDKARFEAAKTALNSHTDGLFGLDATAPAALANFWGTAETAFIDRLNSPGHPDPKALTAAIKGLDPDLDGDVIQLDDHTLLVAINWNSIGEVFIAARTGDRYAVAWRIADYASAQAKPDSPLKAWAPSSFLDSCRTRTNEGHWAKCGPLSAQIGALPPVRRGRPEFYVDATYAQEAGATVGGQFHVWRWDGRVARPLFANTYTFMIGQAVGLRVQGDMVILRTKEDFRTFFACGACEGRQTDWRLRIGDTVEDLGKVSVVPELDLIDRTYSRLAVGAPVSDLAEPAAAKRMRAQIVGARKESHDLPVSVRMGMLGSWKAVRLGSIERVCVELDEPGTQLFTISTAGRRMRIVSVRDYPNDCKVLPGHELRGDLG